MRRLVRQMGLVWAAGIGLSLSMGGIEARAQDLKVYISADMEGIAGLTASAQLSTTGSDYALGRRLMADEVNAAVDAAFDAGATDVVVNDSHGSMTNLLPDQIDRRATLITGRPKPFMMMEGIDETFDAVIFIGYHARASTADGVRDHTYTGQLKRVQLNGHEVGEYGLNAALAGHFGVPVVFISGDRAVASQAAAFIPGIETVAVKEGIGPTAARSMHPAEALERIAAGVRTALARHDDIAPVVLERPVMIEVEVSTSGQADAVMLVPGMQRVSARVVRYEAPDMAVAHRISTLVAVLATN